MMRLNAVADKCGWVTCRSRAANPTSNSPLSVKLTAEGVRTSPSALGISLASPSRQYAAALFVVPKSIPISINSPKLIWRDPDADYIWHSSAGKVINGNYLSPPVIASDDAVGISVI
jgi:hypothetical protein